MSDLQGLHLYIDCFSGISGDMMLGALIDLGVPEAVVTEAISALQLPGVELRHESVRRGGLAGRQVEVMVHGHAAGEAHGPVAYTHHHQGPHDDPSHHADHHGDRHEHRAHAEIRTLVATRSAGPVARIALAIFDRIAAVEARRHGVALADVVLHEIGAADSIADIVGVAAALAWLAPCAVSSRAVALGGGSVRTAHGVLPVPAPATLELLAGCQVEAGGDVELTTPTGAALVAASLSGFVNGAPRKEAFGPMPSGRVRAIGWGAGHRDFVDRANLLRLVLLEPKPASGDEVVLLEANVDDMSAELIAPLLEALLEAGAVDAWWQPIVMKKGRPALLLSALVSEAQRAGVEACLFRESSTLGVRRSVRQRAVLAREVVSVATELGPIAVKLAGRRDEHGVWLEVTVAAPELEDCRRVARETGLPLPRVYQIASAAAVVLLTPSPH